jgi:diacylglycerol kinase family enzyme
VRVTLIHKPGAGEGEHSRAELEEVLAGAGHEVRYQPTDDPRWAEALAEPADLVVAAGGDGTVGSILTALAGCGIPVAIVPLGSANNIARTLGVDGVDPARLGRGWEGEPRRPFDIGAVARPWGETTFVESFGGGVFADVLLRAAADPAEPAGEEKHRHGQRLLLDAILEAGAHRWGLVLDGRDLSGDLIAVQVMNTREIGPHLPLAPRADPGDGLLDLVLIGAEHRDRLRELVEMPEDERPATRPFPVARGRRLEVAFPPGCAVHADDTAWPSPGPSEGEEASVTVGERRAEVLVPAAGEPASRRRPRARGGRRRGALRAAGGRPTSRS